MTAFAVRMRGCAVSVILLITGAAAPLGAFAQTPGSSEKHLFEPRFKMYENLDTSARQMRSRIGSFSSLPPDSPYRTGYEERLIALWDVFEDRSLPIDQRRTAAIDYARLGETHAAALAKITQKILRVQRGEPEDGGPKDLSGQIATVRPSALNIDITAKVGEAFTPVTRGTVPSKFYDPGTCCRKQSEILSSPTVSKFPPFLTFEAGIAPDGQAYMIPGRSFVPSLAGAKAYLTPSIAITSIDGWSFRAKNREEAENAIVQLILYGREVLSGNAAYIEYLTLTGSGREANGNVTRSFERSSNGALAKRAMLIPVGSSWDQLKEYREMLRDAEAARLGNAVVRAAVSQAASEMVSVLTESYSQMLDRQRRECAARAQLSGRIGLLSVCSDMFQ